ncbi:MAG: cupin domain-containing protein [Proteobacteria bacterium]|nr:cupin domain-containing protein [Burkholderiales bacterium]
MIDTRMALCWPRGLDARRFLQCYWQKAPLLVRGALPGFRDRLPRARLAALAQREDVESRMIARTRRGDGYRYRVEHGPQNARSLARLERPDATLLVQGVEAHVAQARAVFDAFGFVPLARRDDLMVSDASPGGGVGPHVDSYDVFLLQARGRRSWRIARAFDEALDEDAPLKILARFRAEQEFVLEPGDFLYLPPGVAHDGIALDACATWSIGFRAPGARELAHDWLAFVDDRFDRDARYADPDLQMQRSGAWLSDQFVERSRRMLGRLVFDRARFEEFLGAYLTEPKAHVRFVAPARPISFERFVETARINGVALAAASRMLHRGRYLFINGEVATVPMRARAHARRLADHRSLDGAHLPADVDGGRWANALYDWYCSGYIRLR